jgi:hypothetical protein
MCENRHEIMGVNLEGSVLEIGVMPTNNKPAIGTSSVKKISYGDLVLLRFTWLIRLW